MPATTNTLAYFVTPSVINVNLKNNFFLTKGMGNEARLIGHDKLSKSHASLQGSLYPKNYTFLKMLVGDKHSSLFCRTVLLKASPFLLEVKKIKPEWHFCDSTFDYPLGA
jgi:hypothetical protein